MKPRHIALFARSLGGGGGVERVVIQLAGALARRGHRVEIVLARRRGRFIDEIPSNVALVSLDAGPAAFALPYLLRAPATLAALLPAMFTPGVAQVLGAIPALSRYLEREKPDALLGALDYANVTAIVARELSGISSVRVVASVHNHLSSAVANAERPHLRRILPLIRTFYPRADAVVCVSQGVAADLVQRANLAGVRVETVYNPVVTDRLDALAAAPVSHRWFNGNGPPVIVAAGKLRRQKDFATLIRAFAELRRERPARLLILGEGPERNSLEALPRELGCDSDVDLAGFEPNPYRYMRAASVFVLSSAWEGFGNVLVEAMACGCAVVSTDCPSGPAEILEHGRYGPLVPTGDVAAMAAAIRAQLDDPPDPARGRARADEFSDAASAAAYERILVPAEDTMSGDSDPD